MTQSSHKFTVLIRKRFNWHQWRQCLSHGELLKLDENDKTYAPSKQFKSFLYCALLILLFRFSITLLVWVFPQGRDGEIISYWKNSNYGVSIALENSRPVFHVNSIDRITKYSVKSKNNLLLNEWSHIAGAYDNESQVAKLYVDGIEVANATATGILELATESPLWLGYLFKGRLSQVWVFKNALSLYKVSQIKDYQKPSSPSKQTSSFVNLSCLVCLNVYVLRGITP